MARTEGSDAGVPAAGLAAVLRHWERVVAGAVAGEHGDEVFTTEYFGPLLAVFVYDDADYQVTLDLVDATSRYGLTGAVFARDRAAITAAARTLRFAAGNLYVNDKPAGAVVAQQPFGGGRASGTNDKAGSAASLLRWTSPRSMKEALA